MKRIRGKVCQHLFPFTLFALYKIYIECEYEIYPSLSARELMQEGVVSPLIIDNTNTQAWGDEAICVYGGWSLNVIIERGM